jgi:hypothetical protein
MNNVNDIDTVQVTDALIVRYLDELLSVGGRDVIVHDCVLPETDHEMRCAASAVVAVTATRSTAAATVLRRARLTRVTSLVIPPDSPQSIAEASLFVNLVSSRARRVWECRNDSVTMGGATPTRIAVQQA